MAPNHQNALMDALVIIYTFRDKTIFLARADIFNNQIIARFLRLFRVLPVYRMRDGKEGLLQNQSTFDYSTDILKNKCRMCILPEGNHEGKHKLRPLKKGIARVAFQVAQETDFKLSVKIVPVGIEYSDYENSLSTVIVNYGKPIDTSEYYNLYKEHPQKAINILMDRLKKAMIQSMFHSNNDKNYYIYESARKIYRKSLLAKAEKKSSNPVLDYKADKLTIRILDQYSETNQNEIDTLREKINAYEKELKSVQLTDEVLQLNSSSIIKLLIISILSLPALPIVLFGIINNYIPYLIPHLVIKKIRDRQFHSSLKFGISLILFPIYYFILFFVILSIEPYGWIKYVYVITSAASGLFSLYYINWLKDLKNNWKYSLLSGRKDNKIQNLQNKRKEIIQFIDIIVQKTGYDKKLASK
jgi:1-acyl-sn-glycerol-3-phosphate acyltransferase